MSRSGTSTPRNFTSQAALSEDILKSQTVGLVKLDDFRRKRRDAEELKSTDADLLREGTSSPKTESDGIPKNHGFKKKKRKIEKRGLLSFGDEDGDIATSNEQDNDENKKSTLSSTETTCQEVEDQPVKKRRFLPNPNTGLAAPKAITKASLAAEASERERLRKEFVEIQEQVRNSEIAVPFVFYDGSNTPGGIVKIKKGDHIWLFLEKCRKLGAELGVSSSGSIEGGGTAARVEGKKSWARIGVDDLMLVRGEMIVPHHYEFYYFIANKVHEPGHPERLLFNYTASASNAVTNEVLLRIPRNEKVEGQDDDPGFTKVVDRRWYEKNKHIYPASMWREFKVGKEFEQSSGSRRDAEGNSFFFS